MEFIPGGKDGKKPDGARAPRPKNCFVLFRIDEAPGIKLMNPGMSNNDQCKFNKATLHLLPLLTLLTAKVAAMKWNNATPEVRAEYKRRSDVEKREHAIKYPGYQYQPRKPSEKKKRMTKNKLAKLAAANLPTVTGNYALDAQQQLPDATPAAVAQHTMDEMIAFQITGDFEMVGSLDAFDAPTGTPQQARTFDAFAEQSRQDILDGQADSFIDLDLAFDPSTDYTTVGDGGDWDAPTPAPAESDENQIFGKVWKDFINT